MSYDSLAEIRGQIERVTYTNEENGYTVARVKVYGRTDLVTVVGSIMNPTPDSDLATAVRSPVDSRTFRVF